MKIRIFHSRKMNKKDSPEDRKITYQCKSNSGDIQYSKRRRRSLPSGLLRTTTAPSQNNLPSSSWTTLSQWSSQNERIEAATSTRSMTFRSLLAKVSPMRSSRNSPLASRSRSASITSFHSEEDIEKEYLAQTSYHSENGAEYGTGAETQFPAVRMLEWVLQNQTTRSSLREYLVREYSEENFDFWLEVEQYKASLHSDYPLLTGFQNIYNNFFGQKTGPILNVSGLTLNRLKGSHSLACSGLMAKPDLLAVFD